MSRTTRNEPELRIVCPDCRLDTEIDFRYYKRNFEPIRDGEFEFVCPACASARWLVSITRYGVSFELLEEF